MKRISDEMLARMATCMTADERDEMAIPSYMHRNPAMRWMAWRRVGILADLLESACRENFAGTRPTVMDFGCGAGVLFETAARCAETLYGVDIVLDAARMVVSEERLENVQLLGPPEISEVIGPGEVDIVVAAEVLEHLDPLNDTLEMFRSRLRRAGLLLVSVPTENLLYRAGRRLAGFEGEYHHSNAVTIDDTIRRSGFDRVQMRRIPAPGPLAIYWVVAYRSTR